ncbi:hypothetical protein BCS96_06585 [Vibrio breoganii]|uniref:hypothetical protein n=1 Tax=Vibrio breoganii TaxID=553239 RepID=UPI000C841A09|nr:hypothetical protein [Vibrio breoganii]PMG35303.1 hypothetical protein BCU93_17640 [Vibrio breoganii]PMG90788.1 hypothetical protein BCU81_05360 [Vibrio breoganii]PML80803.1 hypothetical protein BCT68_14750 [Vibrio breoganii]PMP00608.1 hypothetical protein BCS96_06585 [Vibrio breoganii]
MNNLELCVLVPSAEGFDQILDENLGKFGTEVVNIKSVIQARELIAHIVRIARVTGWNVNEEGDHVPEYEEITKGYAYALKTKVELKEVFSGTKGIDAKLEAFTNEVADNFMEYMYSKYHFTNEVEARLVDVFESPLNNVTYYGLSETRLQKPRQTTMNILEKLAELPLE